MVFGAHMEIIVGIILIIIALYVLFFMLKIAFKIALFVIALAIVNYTLSETLGIPNYFENIFNTKNIEKMKSNAASLDF